MLLLSSLERILCLLMSKFQCKRLLLSRPMFSKGLYNERKIRLKNQEIYRYIFIDFEGICFLIFCRYNTVVKAQEERRMEVTEKSKQITLANQKPFSFYERDLNKQKSQKNEEPIPQFKSKPVPQ